MHPAMDRNTINNAATIVNSRRGNGDGTTNTVADAADDTTTDEWRVVLGDE